MILIDPSESFIYSGKCYLLEQWYDNGTVEAKCMHYSYNDLKSIEFWVDYEYNLTVF